MIKLSHLPVRIVTGAFLLNSGLSKRNLTEEAAEGLQGMAAMAVPFVSDLDAKTFGKLLSAAEIGLGVTLLVPFIPSWLAGAALTGFSGSLLRMYLKAPGMTEPDGIRPTADGVALAKDVWMVGIGTTLVIDDVQERRRHRSARD
ncbi:hypothetical protein [Microlunatus sp. Y2014]|uniref:hypothetical protein n=1 Tax=Microlunatus sp. Y2014 TaxID=3418488 RepID=UPI003DA6FF72